MNNHLEHTIPEDALIQASHWEKVATRTLGIGLALAVAVGGCAVGKQVYDEVHNPDYEISILDIPLDN